MSSSIVPHGPLAQRLARGMAWDEPTIIFDRFGLTFAVADAMRRRARNERFFVRALLQTETALRLDAVAAQIVSPDRTLDESREMWAVAAYGNLLVNNDRPLRDLAVYSDTERRLVSAMLRLGDGYVAATESERHRIAALSGTQHPYFTKVASRDELVPAPLHASSDMGDSIVVWAPDLSGDCAQAFILPLLDFKTHILVISATDPGRPGIAEFSRIGRARHALERAKVIVDTSSYGADTALSLSRWGKALVCDLASGATECLHGVQTYDRRYAASLADAVLSALGSTPSVYSQRTVAPAPRVEFRSSEPLVSVLIPTFDRKDLLVHALESVRRQEYKNIETIVAVDGGPRVDDLADSYSDVRFMYNETNDIYATAKMAFAATHGIYVNFLNDDDLFFPNHISSLVAALERGTSAVAHADVITAYLRGNAESGWELYGVDSSLSSSADPTELLITNRIDMISCMFRRELIADGTPFDPAIPYFGDYSMWLTFLRAHDFIHVPKITSCYTVRNGGVHQQSITWSDKRVAGFEALYAREPVNNRPILQHRRGQHLNAVKTGAIGLPQAPPATVPLSCWPPWA